MNLDRLPERHPDLLDACRSRLVVVDMQERLLEGIANADEVIGRCRALVEASKLFAAPAVATEQNPEKLGGTVAGIDVPDRRAKMAFSGADALDFGVAVGGLAAAADVRDQVVVCGIETPVCVLQTAMDLTLHGWGVSVVVDACGARRAFDESVAVRRLEAAGVQVVTTDMVLFEWAGAAGTDAFRAVSKIVKRLG